jgi:hypothetical protein
MKNIILIGNGFDLAHNLPTSYNQFIQKMTKDSEENQNLDNLITVDDTINNDVSNRKKNTSYVKKDKCEKYVISSKNELLLKICNEIESNKWCDIEELYFKELSKRTDSNIKPLHNQFNQIKEQLELYLFNLETPKPINAFGTLFNELNTEGNTLCINFNYTSVFSNLYKQSIPIECINIHGELNNPSNPIVFGYAATEAQNEELLLKNNNEFLKNIKTYHYNRTPIERKLNQFLKSNEMFNVYIIGHSCGLADSNILHRILSHDKLRAIEVLYYENYDKYFDTIVNIRRILGSKENFDRTMNFSESIKCPQHDEGYNQTSLDLLLKKKKYEIKKDMDPFF